MKKNGKKNGAEQPSAPIKDEVLELGGRRFVLSARASFRQDARVMDLADRSGFAGFLMDVAAKPGIAADRDIARQLIVKGYREGTLFDLAAAVLREENQEKWTEAHAAEVAEFLAELTDPADKQKLSDHILGMLLGFFAAARQGLAVSQPSAATPRSDPDTTTTSSTGPTAAPSSAGTGPG